MENLSNQSHHGFRLYLVVAQGLTLRDLIPDATPLSKQLKMLRRKSWRELFLSCLAGALIEWLMGYRGRHVLVGNDDVTMDRNFFGHHYYQSNTVFDRYPNILGWVVIDSENPIDLERYGDRTYGPIVWIYVWGTVGRLLSAATRGLIRHDNCISLAREAMSQAGVELPRRIYSPAKLVLWLTENGYDFFATEPTKDCGSAD